MQTTDIIEELKKLKAEYPNLENSEILKILEITYLSKLNSTIGRLRR